MPQKPKRRAKKRKIPKTNFPSGASTTHSAPLTQNSNLMNKSNPNSSLPRNIISKPPTTPQGSARKR
jgi:hypothetical protein